MLKKLLRILSFFTIVLLLSACKEKAILDNLTQEQANQVLAILQQHNISADKSGTLKAGYSITVNNSDITVALSVINQYQLPWAADVQIRQAFPDSSLVASPNAEQARVISLQEQRLEQTLRIVAQVVNAKVHISYPPFDNGSANKRPSAHVGILISYKGEMDENTFVSKIKSLIKNSINDVRYENISIVLFPASTIQYSSPTKLPEAMPGLWEIIISLIIIFALIITGYLIFKSSQTGLTKKELVSESGGEGVNQK
ncbi:type III secretion inner membrane ring lipoprotein SctJ [Erwinia tracheiphila]|uniref:Lipoprotein n=1 Tax=Erwinia tracheiphila TaxID=65700 RepID=A0A345CW33_9GAMM|nr:type III secretion inner membrane ring lipoprotein SctJ [Erwinia tracheiphila]AXF77650.1 EscJ/YscJ/HrcJ family type III secretion inner membrane ring protein [Erwinia tracheiphila]UIA83663.1 type III secretion inner membrane ring lipoprotein SctJ [Erwinia tracheiphila]UIA92245.1 type III secretion inner membrane ring lipoprotein SctJ [Erwinia tracheiphila]